MPKRKRKQHATEMTSEEIVREVFPPEAIDALREATGEKDEENDEESTEEER